MKIFWLVLFLSVSTFGIDKKNKKLSPFQSKIDQCFIGQIEVKNLVEIKELYLEIVKNYALRASETVYREVVYSVGTEKRKLRFEDGTVQIFKVDSEDNVALLSTETLSKDPQNDKLRYKTKSPEARLDQLLNRAEIKSDFVKTVEYRDKQLVLNLVWSDGKIRNLNAQFSADRMKLDCQKKSSADICDCRH